MSIFLLSAVWPLLLGYCMLRLLAPDIGLILQICFGTGIGAGLASCCFFVSLAAGLPSMSLEVGALIAVTALCFRRYRRTGAACPASPSIPTPWTVADWIVCAAFVCAASAGLAVFLSELNNHPHGGGWDAFAIWNLRARFLATSAWRDGFSPFLFYSHPDYPLLLPGFIARTWRVTGGREVSVPALAAALFTFSTVGVLVGSLSALKGRKQGFVAGILLVGTHFFAVHGASEYADVPVGYFLLSTFAALALVFRAPVNQAGLPEGKLLPFRHPGQAETRLPVLPGVTAGLAVWTKNEGWVLVAALLAIGVLGFLRLGVRPAYRRVCRAIAAGSAPVLAITLYLKQTFATANEFVGARTLHSLMVEISNPDRYLRIGHGLLDAVDGSSGGAFLFPVLGVAAYALITAGSAATGFDGNRSAARLCGCILAVVLAGYCATMLISPYAIDWQVATTLDRLLVQLLPAALFTAFLGLRTLE